MSQEPHQVQSSRLVGLFNVLKPVLLVAFVFWVGPEHLAGFYELLAVAPAH